MKSHYDTLGISISSSKEIVKKEYRKLCLQYHPDLSKTKSKSTSNAEVFKQISAAYAVLSDDKQRTLYDLELEEYKQFGRIRRPQGGNGNGYGNGNGGTGRGPFGRQPSGMAYRFHILDGIYKPKNMLLGLALGFATVATVKAMLGVDPEETTMQKNKKQDGKVLLVEAWFNKRNQQWEQPAPWSSSFRDLKPEIHLVPREKVRPASK